MSPAITPGPRLKSVKDVVHGIPIHARVSSQPASDDWAPLIFVHGLGLSVRYLEPTMTRLAGDYSVAGLDLPGFGRSGNPPAALDVSGLCNALAGWLDARGIGPAIFVGSSFGCQVIIELASREPSRVLGLVLNAPMMDPAYRSMGKQLLRMLADVPYEPWTLGILGIRDYARAGPMRLMATFRYALNYHIETKLPKLVAPALIVCSARDPLVTVDWGTELTRLVGLSALGAAGASMSVVPAAAHALPYDDPAVFAALIAKFVERARMLSRAR